MILEAISAGASKRFNQARSPMMDQTKPGPPGWRMGVGLIPHPVKTSSFAETTTITTTTRGPIADLRLPSDSMITSAQSLQQEDMVRTIVCLATETRPA